MQLYEQSFWYVKHKTKIKSLVKKLNTFIADIEQKLLRHPNTLCLRVNISTLILSPLGFCFRFYLSSLCKWFSNNWILLNVSKTYSVTSLKVELPSQLQLKLSKFQYIKPLKKVSEKLIFKWVMIFMRSLVVFWLSSWWFTLRTKIDD